MRLAALARLGERRRRRGSPRADAPRTIVPPRTEDPLASIDAARERLRAQIAPLGDDDAGPRRPPKRG
jgi:hypothetical protein